MWPRQMSSTSSTKSQPSHAVLSDRFHPHSVPGNVTVSSVRSAISPSRHLHLPSLQASSGASQVFDPESEAACLCFSFLARNRCCGCLKIRYT